QYICERRSGWRGDLIGQGDFTPLLGGLEDSQDHLQRRAAPPAIGEDPVPARNGVGHLFEIRRAITVRRAGDLLAAIVRVDEDAVRRLPKIAVLAARDREAKDRLLALAVDF